MTFEQVEAACRARFGGAAPSLGTIRRYWISRFGPGVRTRRAVKPPRSIVSDPELRAFIDERLSRMTFDEVTAACRMRFGVDRAPSHQTIIRYWWAIFRPRLAMKRGRSSSFVDRAGARERTRLGRELVGHRWHPRKGALTNAAIAQAAWKEPPDWITVLARQCDKTSQNGVGRMLGVSAAHVNLALRNRCSFSLSRLEALVRRHLMVGGGIPDAKEGRWRAAGG